MYKRYFFLLGLFTPGLVSAQTVPVGLVNNGAKIVVTSGSNIYVNGTTGHFTNMNGGQITNNTTGGTITVNGDWTNNAANSVFADDGTTVVLGSSAAQAVTGSNGTAFYKLTASGGGTKTVSTASTISNLLTLGNSTIFNSNGKITLLATATKTSNVAAIPSSSSVTGDMNVQVYFTGGSSAYRGTRGISAPINENTATTKTYAQLKNYMVITGPNGSSKGFDPGGSASPNAVTLTRYNEPATISQSTFTSVSSISDVLAPGNGVFLFYRGDRTGYTSATASTSNKVNAPYAVPESTTMVWTGPINQQNVTVNLSYTNNAGEDAYNGYNFIGNPYPATINWKLVTKNNVADRVRIIKAGGGVLTYYVDANGNEVVSPSGVAASDIYTIAPGQGFYVMATAANASVTFTESCKAVTTTPVKYLYTGAKDNVLMASGFDAPVAKTASSSSLKLLRIQLKDAVNTEECVALFGEKASAAATAEDVPYLSGTTIALSSLSSDNVKLTINCLPLITASTEIKLSVTSASSGDNTLNFTDLSALADNNVYLKDSYTNTLTDVKITPTYNFSIDKNIATSYGDSRFSLVVIPSTTLAVKISNFKASKVAGGAKLSWAAASEDGLVRYEIEKSTNGTDFQKINEIVQIGKSSYSVLDENPASSINYYRLKAIDNSGKENLYLAALNYELNSDNEISIFPNPAASYVRVKLPESHTVKLSIIDMAGKELKSNSFTETALVQENVSDLPVGTYILQLVDTSNNSIITKSKIIIQR